MPFLDLPSEWHLDPRLPGLRLQAGPPDVLAAVRFPLTVSGRRILMHGGRVAWGEEIPLELAFNPRVSVAGAWRRFRLEVRAEAGVGVGEDLVLAALEYSLGWYASRPFRRPLRRSRGERERAARAEIGGAMGGADPFWAGRGIVASMDEPWHYDPDAVERPRFSGFVLGICEDFREYQAELARDEGVVRLEEWTRSGTLRYAFAGPVDGEKRPVSLEIPVELCDDCVSDLYGLAVPLALGGPETTEGPGTLAAELVGRIYRDLVNNRMRRVRRRRGLPLEGAHARPASTQPVLNPQEKELLRLVKVRHVDLGEAARRLEMEPREAWKMLREVCERLGIGTDGIEEP